MLALITNVSANSWAIKHLTSIFTSDILEYCSIRSS